MLKISMIFGIIFRYGKKEIIEMNRTKRILVSSLIKEFKEKGYNTDELEEYIDDSYYEKRKQKHHKARKITDLKDVMNQSYELFKDRPMFVYKTETPGELKETSFGDFIDDVNALGTKLIDMGLKDKRIAVISDNREEWCKAYLATVCGTGVIVPLDKLLPANEIESLIVRSGVQAIFYSDKYSDIMDDIRKRNTTDLRYYISMDLDKRKNGVYSQNELIKKGKALIDDGDTSFINAEIDPNVMAIMLFTSGTTAMSKAVMLSHKNICTNLMDIASQIELKETDRFLSILPLHHTFECTVGFLDALYNGCSTAYCEGLKHILANLNDFKITCMIAVPALYNVMYKKTIRTIEKKGKLQDLERGIKISSMVSKTGIDIRRKLFKEIIDNFGGKLRLLVNGGAALDKETEEGFNNLGIKIYQGYGLTETSPVLSSGNDFGARVGSVGQVYPSVKIKFLDKDVDGIGEIAVKGPSVMLGYFNNDEANREVFERGWFKTGDLGYIDKNGYLFLMGRKKNVIVLKNGKNVYPDEIENVINRIPGIKESFVFGRPESDDPTDLRLECKMVYDEALFKEIHKLSKEEDIKEFLDEKIKEINKTMPNYKFIKEVYITTEPLIKTTTLKIKRFEEMKKMGIDLKAGQAKEKAEDKKAETSEESDNEK